MLFPPSPQRMTLQSLSSLLPLTSCRLCTIVSLSRNPIPGFCRVFFFFFRKKMTSFFGNWKPHGCFPFVKFRKRRASVFCVVRIFPPPSASLTPEGWTSPFCPPHPSDGTGPMSLLSCFSSYRQRSSDEAFFRRARDLTPISFSLLPPPATMRACRVFC